MFVWAHIPVHSVGRRMEETMHRKHYFGCGHRGFSPDSCIGPWLGRADISFRCWA